MDDFYGIGEHKDANWKAFLRFVRLAKKDRKEGNKEAFRVDLEQIRGRVSNLLMELEQDV